MHRQPTFTYRRRSCTPLYRILSSRNPSSHNPRYCTLSSRTPPLLSDRCRIVTPRNHHQTLIPVAVALPPPTPHHGGDTDCPIFLTLLYLAASRGRCRIVTPR